jgi:uncharacterized NAD-dependent epimerase/dehydratase family protein
MLDPALPMAIYMEGALGLDIGKMGCGVLRYSPNPVVCAVDSTHAGGSTADITGIPRDAPVVATVEEAANMGAQVLVLGIAPPGGRMPPEWLSAMDEAVKHGLSLVNGLHEPLAPRYPNLKPGQWVWDIRVEPPDLQVGGGKAAGLTNRRVLMIGTDMAVGKMTAGLEIHKLALERGIKSSFVATGQIGITIMGSGVPLDAIRLDYASGAIEREVVAVADSELIIVEGQGALCHPGSSATLPLLRGSCPTHLILCHRADQTHLKRHPHIAIPPLGGYMRLYEDLASAGGPFPRPEAVGIALNTSHLPEDEGLEAARELEERWKVPCLDPVRHGVSRLLDAILE